jgi:hypothetical protein
MIETYVSLGPQMAVRVRLCAMAPAGPYRLTVEHPAKPLVEYFDSEQAALVRRAEIESALARW